MAFVIMQYVLYIVTIIVNIYFIDVDIHDITWIFIGEIDEIYISSLVLKIHNHNDTLSP